MYFFNVNLFAKITTNKFMYVYFIKLLQNVIYKTTYLRIFTIEYERIVYCLDENILYMTIYTMSVKKEKMRRTFGNTAFCRSLFYLFFLCFIYSSNFSLSAQSLSWVKTTGGKDSDFCAALWRDQSSQVYDIISFRDTFTNVNGQKFFSFGEEDWVIRKFTSSGVFLWAEKFGSLGKDAAYSVTTDFNGNVYIVGTFTGQLRLGNQPILNSPFPSAEQGFLILLDPNGEFVLARMFTSTQGTFPQKITVDSNGRMIVSGYFSGQTDFDLSGNSFALESNGGKDGFVATYLPGVLLEWASKIGGSGEDAVLDHEKGELGNIYLTGFFSDIVDFDQSNNNFYAQAAGSEDIFILKISSNGSFVWVRTAGSSDIDKSLTLDVLPNGTAFIGGYFSSFTEFSQQGGSSQLLSSAGFSDGFVASYLADGSISWIRQIGGVGEDEVTSVDANNNGQIYAGGNFTQSVNFGFTGLQQYNATSVGLKDIFTIILNEDGSTNDVFTFGSKGNDCMGTTLAFGTGSVLLCGSFSDTIDLNPSPIVENYFTNGQSDAFLLNFFFCTKPFIPKITPLISSFCSEDTLHFSIPGARLNGAAEWQWYVDSCGGTPVRTGETLSIQLNQDTKIYVAGNGGCLLTPFCTEKNMTLFRDTLTVLDVSICSGDSLQVGDAFYLIPGQYIDSLTSVAGCDSIVILNLEVRPEFNIQQSVTICSNDTLFVGPYHLTESGSYVHVLTATNGCDSIVNTNLTVIETLTTYFDTTICKGNFIVVGDSIYTADGQYTNQSQDSFGCVQIQVTNLSVVPAQYQFYLEFCEGDTAYVGNKKYTESGDVFELLTSYSGCDSIVTTTLFFKPVSSFSQTFTICQGDAIVVNNKVYDLQGTYQDTLSNAFGCDSILITSLFVIPEIPVRVVDTIICQGQSIVIGKNKYSQSGTFTEILQSASGCDSTIVLKIKVNPVFLENTVKICRGDSIIIGNSTYKNSGFYIDSLISTNQCDSIIYTSLQVVEPVLKNISFEICQGDTVFIGEKAYTGGGQYIDTLSGKTGCDSIVFSTIKVNQKKFVQEIEICQGDSIIVGTNVYAVTGFYMDTFARVIACDSILLTRLTVNESPYIVQNISICAEDTYKIGNNEYKNPGKYIDSFKTLSGCDSIVETNLSIKPYPKKTINPSICKGEVFKYGTYSFAFQGRYELLLKYAGACDTLLIINLKVINFDTKITVEGGLLKVIPEENAVYQWFNCTGDTLVIEGANQYFFKPDSSGRYLVRITYQGCTFTSDCFEFIKSSTEQESDVPFTCFPNPTFSVVHVLTSQHYSYELFDLNGRKLDSGKLLSGTNQIDMEKYLPGIYILCLSDEGRNSFYARLIKQ